MDPILAALCGYALGVAVIGACAWRNGAKARDEGYATGWSDGARAANTVGNVLKSEDGFTWRPTQCSLPPVDYPLDVYEGRPGKWVRH